jgi:hypothetical protein
VVFDHHGVNNFCEFFIKVCFDCYTFLCDYEPSCTFVCIMALGNFV